MTESPCDPITVALEEAFAANRSSDYFRDITRYARFLCYTDYRHAA